MQTCFEKKSDFFFKLSLNKIPKYFGHRVPKNWAPDAQNWAPDAQNWAPNFGHQTARHPSL